MWPDGDGDVAWRLSHGLLPVSSHGYGGGTSLWLKLREIEFLRHRLVAARAIRSGGENSLRVSHTGSTTFVCTAIERISFVYVALTV